MFVVFFSPFLVICLIQNGDEILTLYFCPVLRIIVIGLSVPLANGSAFTILHLNVSP